MKHMNILSHSTKKERKKSRDKSRNIIRIFKNLNNKKFLVKIINKVVMKK